jgi:hypothetical protein
MSEQSPPWVRHGRAAFVVLHLVAVGLAAIPAPVGGMNRGAWKTPTVRTEIDAWADRLGVEREAFEQDLWDLAVGVMAVRKVALAPFQPYYHRLGAQQSWRMFVAPHTHPSRLHIDIEEGGEWYNIYEQTTAGEHYLEDELEGDRFRSALFRYAWPAFKGPYQHLARWVAGRVAEDFPDATRVRLRWHQRATPSPEDMRAGRIDEGRFHSAFVVAIEREP